MKYPNCQACVPRKLLSLQKRVIGVARLPLEEDCRRSRRSRPAGLPHLENEQKTPTEETEEGRQTEQSQNKARTKPEKL